jgi:hypothetical protein
LYFAFLILVYQAVHACFILFVLSAPPLLFPRPFVAKVTTNNVSNHTYHNHYLTLVTNTTTIRHHKPTIAINSSSSIRMITTSPS